MIKASQNDHGYPSSSHSSGVDGLLASRVLVDETRDEAALTLDDCGKAEPDDVEGGVKLLRGRWGTDISCVVDEPLFEAEFEREESRRLEDRDDDGDGGSKPNAVCRFAIIARSLARSADFALALRADGWGGSRGTWEEFEC